MHCREVPHCRNLDCLQDHECGEDHMSRMAIVFVVVLELSHRSGRSWWLSLLTESVERWRNQPAASIKFAVLNHASQASLAVKGILDHQAVIKESIKDSTTKQAWAWVLVHTSCCLHAIY